MRLPSGGGTPPRYRFRYHVARGDPALHGTTATRRRILESSSPGSSAVCRSGRSPPRSEARSHRSRRSRAAIAYRRSERCCASSTPRDSSSSWGSAGTTCRGPTPMRSRSWASPCSAPCTRTPRTAWPITSSSGSRSRGKHLGEGGTSRGEVRYRLRHRNGGRERPRSAAAAGAGAAAAPACRGAGLAPRGHPGRERVPAPNAVVSAVRAGERSVDRRRHRATLLEPVLARHADVLVGGHVRRIPDPPPAGISNRVATLQRGPRDPRSSL